MAGTSSAQQDLDAPAYGGFAVTTSDSVNFGFPARALYIGVSGDVVAVLLDGSALTFKSVPIGILPVRCSRVNATGTTATNIIGLF